MAMLNMTAADLNTVIQLKDQGKIAEAWQFLGTKGDAYAFLAGEIVSSNTASMPLLAQVFYNLVRIQWDNTAGAGLWGGDVFWASTSRAQLFTNVKSIGDWYAASGTPLTMRGAANDAFYQEIERRVA